MIEILGYSRESLNIEKATQYLSVRLVDPNSFTVSQRPLVNFILTAKFNTKIRFNKQLKNSLSGVMPHQFFSCAGVDIVNFQN